MFKVIALFGFKKSSKPFKDYYNGWFKTLKNTLLPQLRHAMSSSSTSTPILLDSHVEVIPLAREWGKCEGRKAEMKGAVMESAGAVMESAAVEMEELVGVFVDANRLRRSVINLVRE